MVVSECRSYEFTCANKLCVSVSYLCDGFYDCGCGANCDEDNCGDVSISAYALVPLLDLMTSKRILAVFINQSNSIKMISFTSIIRIFHIHNYILW